MALAGTSNATLIGDTINGCFGSLGCFADPTPPNAGPPFNHFNQNEVVISDTEVEFTGNWFAGDGTLLAIADFVRAPYSYH